MPRIELEGQRALTIAKRLVQARKLRGLTPREAAERLDIAPSTLNEHEHGKNAYNAGLLIAYADLYGVTPDWFLREDGEPPVTDDLDRVAIAALRELPPEQQRALLLKYWPALRDLCRDVVPRGTIGVAEGTQ